MIRIVMKKPLQLQLVWSWRFSLLSDVQMIAEL